MKQNAFLGLCKEAPPSHSCYKLSHHNLFLYDPTAMVQCRVKRIKHPRASSCVNLPHPIFVFPRFLITPTGRVWSLSHHSSYRGTLSLKGKHFPFISSGLLTQSRYYQQQLFSFGCYRRYFTISGQGGWCLMFFWWFPPANNWGNFEPIPLGSRIGKACWLLLCGTVSTFETEDPYKTVHFILQDWSWTREAEIDVCTVLSREGVVGGGRYAPLGIVLSTICLPLEKNGRERR